MGEDEIVKLLKEHFVKVNNPVLKFINYTTNQTEILVKGTPEEWRKFIESKL